MPEPRIVAFCEKCYAVEQFPSSRGAPVRECLQAATNEAQSLDFDFETRSLTRLGFLFRIWGWTRPGMRQSPPGGSRKGLSITTNFGIIGSSQPGTRLIGQGRAVVTRSFPLFAPTGSLSNHVQMLAPIVYPFQKTWQRFSEKSLEPSLGPRENPLFHARLLPFAKVLRRFCISPAYCQILRKILDAAGMGPYHKDNTMPEPPTVALKKLDGVMRTSFRDAWDVRWFDRPGAGPRTSKFLLQCSKTVCGGLAFRLAIPQSFRNCQTLESL